MLEILEILPICNKCSVFEENEDVDMVEEWTAGKNVA